MRGQGEVGDFFVSFSFGKGLIYTVMASSVTRAIQGSYRSADLEGSKGVGQGAFIIVYQADRKYNEPDLKESAIADYRQVIKLYPQTMWAGKAQERLNGIGIPKGDIL